MRATTAGWHYPFRMSFYYHRLPHWHPEGRPLFITWRLEGSLPGQRRFPAGAATAGAAFAAADRLLDQAAVGPLYLARPEVAVLVVQALFDGQDVRHDYALHAFVVMPNHVHLLITPETPVPRLMQRLKGSTAHRANQILGRTGEPFWQEESYDHWVRSQREFDRIAAYIEENPVRAGLVETAGDFRWSSAGKAAG